VRRKGIESLDPVDPSADDARGKVPGDESTIRLWGPAQRRHLLHVGLQEALDRFIRRRSRVVAEDEVTESEPTHDARGEEPPDTRWGSLLGARQPKRQAARPPRDFEPIGLGCAPQRLGEERTALNASVLGILPIPLPV